MNEDQAFRRPRLAYRQGTGTGHSTRTAESRVQAKATGGHGVQPLIRVERLSSTTALVSLLGEHDMASAGEVSGTLHELLAEGRRIVVDLSETLFIDSSILLALVSAHDGAAGAARQLVLWLDGNSRVGRILEISGLLDQLPCYSHRKEAIEAVT